MLPNRIVTVNSEGVVVDISTGGRMDGRYGVEFYSGIIIPGMVNAHSHIELSYLKGAIESRSGFAGFAAGITRCREMFSMQERLNAIAYRDSKMWSDGVEVIADISNGDSSVQTKLSSKISYHTFFELFGLGTLSIDTLSQTHAKASQRGVKCSITPHSTYSLNNDMFAASVAATPQAPLSIHFMESTGENELYDGHGELYNWYTKCGFSIDFRSFGSPTERIIKNIGRDRKVLLIHNTMMQADDMEALIAHFGNNLTFVLCPRSNMYISGTLPPFEMLYKRGVRVAVGTDSLASNTSLSMIDELKMFDGIALEDRLQWATSCGAEALGMGMTAGSIEPGRKCGLVLIEGVDWSNRRLTDKAISRRLM